MFRVTGFAEKAHYPHGQQIHVDVNGRCEKWVVMDFERAINFERFERVLMNWPVQRGNETHWEWDCPYGRVSR